MRKRQRKGPPCGHRRRSFAVAEAARDRGSPLGRGEGREEAFEEGECASLNVAKRQSGNLSLSTLSRRRRRRLGKELVLSFAEGPFLALALVLAALSTEWRRSPDASFNLTSKSDAIGGDKREERETKSLALFRERRKKNDLGALLGPYRLSTSSSLFLSFSFSLTFPFLLVQQPPLHLLTAPPLPPPRQAAPPLRSSRSPPPPPSPTPSPPRPPWPRPERSSTST